jgi:condensation domain-containing protein
VIVCAMHHIVSDGWSMSVLIKELVELYAAGAAGRPSALPPVPLQYTDYAAWQHTWRQSAAARAQLRFWTDQLAALPTLDLATDRPRSQSDSHAGACVFRTVDAGTLQTLHIGPRRCPRGDAAGNPELAAY